MTGLRLVTGEEQWLWPQRDLEGKLTESYHGVPRLTASSYPVTAA